VEGEVREWKGSGRALRRRGGEGERGKGGRRETGRKPCRSKDCLRHLEYVRSPETIERLLYKSGIP
jgi:hypothetical protein